MNAINRGRKYEINTISNGQLNGQDTFDRHKETQSTVIMESDNVAIFGFFPDQSAGIVFWTKTVDKIPQIANLVKTYLLLSGGIMTYRVLAINPGSTSTKIAVYDDDQPVFEKTLRHDPAELDKFGGIIEQHDFRKGLVMEAMREKTTLIPKACTPL